MRTDLYQAKRLNQQSKSLKGKTPDQMASLMNFTKQLNIDIKYLKTFKKQTSKETLPN